MSDDAMKWSTDTPQLPPCLSVEIEYRGRRVEWRLDEPTAVTAVETLQVLLAWMGDDTDDPSLWIGPIGDRP